MRFSDDWKKTGEEPRNGVKGYIVILAKDRRCDPQKIIDLARADGAILGNNGKSSIVCTLPNCRPYLYLLPADPEQISAVLRKM